jgi:hypothetical protein
MAVHLTFISIGFSIAAHNRIVNHYAVVILMRIFIALAVTAVFQRRRLLAARAEY